MYKEFILCFTLLSKLDIAIVRYIKNNSIQCDSKFTILKGGEINNVYFIIKGKLTLYDSEMRMYNIFSNDEF